MRLYQNLISEQFEKLSNYTNEKFYSLIGNEYLYFVNFDTIKDKVEKEIDNLKNVSIQNVVTEEMNYALANCIGEEFACEE